MTAVDVGASAPDLGGDDAGAPIPSWTVHGDITQIAEPWVTALGELKEIARSRTADAGTYRYSYAELGDVFSETRPTLAAHGLALFQVPQIDGSDVAMTTVVMHTSGAYLEFAPFLLPAGNTAQSTGSAATYARRYSVTSILGLATEDDDGKNAGTRTDRTVKTTLSAENVDRFLAAAADSLLTAEEIGAVVLDATGGRTIDPAAVYVSEVAALREALHRHSEHDNGVSQDPGAADDQIRPVSPDAVVSAGSSDPADTPLPGIEPDRSTGQSDAR